MIINASRHLYLFTPCRHQLLLLIYSVSLCSGRLQGAWETLCQSTHKYGRMGINWKKRFEILGNRRWSDDGMATMGAHRGRAQSVSTNLTGGQQWECRFSAAAAAAAVGCYSRLQSSSGCHMLAQQSMRAAHSASGSARRAAASSRARPGKAAPLPGSCSRSTPLAARPLSRPPAWQADGRSSLLHAFPMSNFSALLSSQQASI